MTLNLAKLPGFDNLGGAVRIEEPVLPDPILVVLGEDGRYYAYKNACTHTQRMIDPVVGTMTLLCSSVDCKDKSNFDYHGNVSSGLAEGPLTGYQLTVED